MSDLNEHIRRVGALTSFIPKAGSSSALCKADLTLDQPEKPSDFQNDIQEKCAEVSREMHRRYEEAIVSQLPFGFNKKDLHCEIHPGGREVWHHKGRPFIEIHPPEITYEGWTVKVSRPYRLIPTQGTHA